MSDTFFKIFIYFDVFLIGALTMLAARHAYAHFRPDKHEPERPHLSQAVKDRMLHTSEMQYKSVLDHSVKKLENDLNSSAEQINGLIKRFAGEIVGDEMEKYRKGLAQLHEQAAADMSGIKQAVAGHQAEIEAKMLQEIEAEKKFLIQQIDTKLADAVGSFLIETLQHNVDLGSQNDYLIQMLEEHKADFKKEVTDENQPA